MWRGVVRSDAWPWFQNDVDVAVHKLVDLLTLWVGVLLLNDGPEVVLVEEETRDAVKGRQYLLAHVRDPTMVMGGRGRAVRGGDDRRES